MSPPSPADSANNNQQPFFVLHKPSQQQPDPKPPTSNPRAKRKIGFPSEKPDISRPDPQPGDESAFEKLRFDAFRQTWSEIDTTIKDVLRKINLDLFGEVHLWVVEAYSGIESRRPSSLDVVRKPYPIFDDEFCRQIPTAMICTRNVEFVDDLLTFQELGSFLRSKGCYVANLSAIDFPVKNGIGCCLRSLLRQLVQDAPDVPDISVLAAWYSDPATSDQPIVVIIDDIERCSGATLAELIKMLSEWVIKLPVVFIMGVATTVNATRKLLPSDALLHIQAHKFTLGSPGEKMDALVEAILVKPYAGFYVGHRIAVFLRNYFVKHDGTITSFIRALKLACIKHFQTEQLSFLGLAMAEDNFERSLHETSDGLPESMLKRAFDFPSCKRDEVLKATSNNLVHGLSELRRLLKAWNSVVKCLFEVGKQNKIQLLDIFCEAIDPNLSCLRSSNSIIQTSKLNGQNLTTELFGSWNGGYIAQAIHKVRELSLPLVSQLLDLWCSHTEEVSEIHDKVRELQSIKVSADDGKKFKEQLISSQRRSSTAAKATLSLNDKAALLLEGIVWKHLVPIESIPFHEILCFRDVDILNSALIGDPRRTIQVDLLKPRSYLQCSCCRADDVLSSTMHDTSVMYNLAQEYGDLINLHDWYQSFKAAMLNSSSKSKRRTQQSPASKKMKSTLSESEASIQARFCRAVTELQITGLLRMPSKRRPDFVQRIAFGM